MKKLTLGLAAFTLAGCTSVTPQYDARFGDAVRQARQVQTINPVTSAPGAAVGTLEGRTAREASERYHDSFKAPPPVVNVINIGGQLGGGR